MRMLYEPGQGVADLSLMTVRDRLCDKLKVARNEAGLTQAAVAQMLGRPQSYISKLETRTRRIDFVELQVLARVYGKPPSYFEDDAIAEKGLLAGRRSPDPS